MYASRWQNRHATVAKSARPLWDLSWQACSKPAAVSCCWLRCKSGQQIEGEAETWRTVLTVHPAPADQCSMIRVESNLHGDQCVSVTGRQGGCSMLNCQGRHLAGEWPEDHEACANAKKRRVILCLSIALQMKFKLPLISHDIARIMNL